MTLFFLSVLIGEVTIQIDMRKLLLITSVREVTVINKDHHLTRSERMTRLHFFIIIVSVSCRRLWNATIKRVVYKVEKESCRSIIGQTLFSFFAVALTFTLVAQTDSLNILGVLEKKVNRYT